MLRPEAYNTLNALNLCLLDEILLDKTTQMPLVKKCEIIPDNIVSFDKAKRKVNCECGVHFFIEDYAFNSLWISPKRYLKILSKFQCVIAPDYSTYLDMPAPMVRWQIYKRRFLTQWLQKQNINVIYNIQTLQPMFDEDQLQGVERGGVICIKSPLNYKYNKEGRYYFYRIIDKVNEVLRPKIFLFFGNGLILPTDIKYKLYENDNIRIRRTFSKRKRGILD